MSSTKRGFVSSIHNRCRNRISCKTDLYLKSRVIPVGPLSKSKLDDESKKALKAYGNNEIVTSRYRWYSFFFQNLYEQGQRIANFYFICIAVIQLFIETPVSPTSSILPLLFVIFLTMIKQGYEDYLRHRADREINCKHIEVVDEQGVLLFKRSFEIVVGDVVLVCNGETVPCDMVVLSSSESSGECSVTTASLDGETNLKGFKAPTSTRELDSPREIASKLQATITCQQPTTDIYDFSGTITVTNEDTGQEVVQPLTSESLLLRGARLKNTDFIYGCAVYTGNDTKMSLNGKRKTTKFSRIERNLNIFLIVYLIGLILLCVTYTVLKYLLGTMPWYVNQRKVTTWYVIQDFLAFVVLFNYAIPISLYVTIEFQKFIDSLFFGWDLELYDEDMNQRALANTSDIPEEMGQVEYLFSDKTGTLTKNEMTFQRLAIAEGTFLVRDTMLLPLFDMKAKKIRDIKSPRVSGVGLPATKMPINAQLLLIFLALCHTVRVEQDPDMKGTSIVELLNSRKKREGFKKVFESGLNRMRMSKPVPPSKEWTYRRRLSAVLSAQEAVSAVNRGSEIDSGETYEYQASSPDEKTFVEGCRDMGIIYRGQNKQELQVVTVFGKQGLQYRLLDVLEFDSDRKCMSVVIQPVLPGEPETPAYLPDKPALVLCKGADSTLLKKSARLDEHPDLQQATGDPFMDGLFFPPTEKQLAPVLSDHQVIEFVGQFASFGLRTLVEGVRLLKPGEWTPLKRKLNDARTLMEGRALALKKAYASVERDLMLIGCTGVEDKLQDEVPETLTALRDAGIQIWVLTGDKVETAVNVSFLSGHFAPGLVILRVLKQTSLHGCSVALDQQLATLEETRKENHQYRYGLVVDGQSLNYALKETLKDKFLLLCQDAEAVLCCRLTPMQKAEVVRMVKGSRSPCPVTCAVGDGANDVPMILEAHVGIGLFGKEGRQAARASDYALGKFKHLRRALLFHGFNFYWRTANVVLYFFYKNLVFVLAQAYFGFFSKFSTQTVFSSLYLLCYNVIMTSSPIVAYGVTEMRFPEHVLLANPAIYKAVSRNRLLSWQNFFIWNAFGLWHSVVLFFGCYLLASEGVSNPGGANENLYGYGSVLFNLIFLVVTIKLLLTSYSFNFLVIFTIFVTVLTTYAVFALTNFVFNPMEDGRELYGVWGNIFCGVSAMPSLFGHIVFSVLALSPDVVFRAHLDSFRRLPGAKVHPGKRNHSTLISLEVSRPLISQDSSPNVGTPV